MPTRTVLLRAGIVVALFAALFFIISNEPSPAVIVNGQRIAVEVASTEAERSQGLSGRERLRDHEGMLFIHDTEGMPSYWMKDMRFSIDIVWIGLDRRVRGVTSRVQPESFPQMFQSPSPVKYVLEINAGLAQRYQILEGAEVKFEK